VYFLNKRGKKKVITNIYKEYRMNKNLRGILQLCALIDVGALGVITGLLVFWFGNDTRTVSSALGFTSLFSYLGLILSIVPTLLVANAMRKKEELFVSTLFVSAIILAALIQGVLIFLTWLFADSALTKFTSTFDPASIVFIVVSGIGILVKLIIVVTYLTALTGESGEEDEADSEELETVSLVRSSQESPEPEIIRKENGGHRWLQDIPLEEEEERVEIIPKKAAGKYQRRFQK
jgi:hypothetical protein